MQDIAEAVRDGLRRGTPSVIGRVIGLKGFSTLPVDELIAIDADGSQHGDLLGRPGHDQLAPVATEMLAASDRPPVRTVGISIHGAQVAELGLSCGGQADVLLQATASLPEQLWSLLAGRAPVALVTPLTGPGEAIVVDGSGGSWGTAGRVGDPGELARQVEEAHALLRSGRSGRSQVDTDHGSALVEAWIPSPRMVAVGTGDVISAVSAQGALLGWDTRSAADAAGVGELLDWAGATAALIVTSHDPHVDVPALRMGLERGVAYIGAMGSRGTQSRRMDRLVAEGVADSDLDRIHRPIGLNLGGRRAPEVALAIVAEILACHYGRDSRPLKEVKGPIHG